MDKLRQVLNGQDSGSDETVGLAAQIGDSVTLNWSTRIKGFLFCFILGFILSMLGFALIALPKGITLFALFYTIGNILSFASTLFLMGPWKQLKKMFDKDRILSTTLVFAFMILTLLAALDWKKTLLALIFCCLQFFAGIWYSISYIPYAQDAVKKAVLACV